MVLHYKPFGGKKMTKQYNLLLDHNCGGAREWGNRGNLYYEFYACDCSPHERHYKFDWNGKTYDVKFCPACGAKMKKDYGSALRLSRQ